MRLKDIIKKWDWLGYNLKIVNIKLACFSSKFMSDEVFIKQQYKRRTGKNLNLQNPQTFNEKIQWLKLNYHNEILHTCVDKFEVRDYIRTRIKDNDILIKNYGIFNKFEDINFDKLPEKFIMKLTNGSSFNYICKNKNKKEIRKMKRRFKKWLKIDYYLYGREWAYKGVKNRIICEELLEPSSGNPPEDYRFFCFNGRVEAISIDYDSVINGVKNSNYKRNIYNRECERIDAQIEYPNKEGVRLEKTEDIKKMIEYAEILSKDFPHVRVDFYYFDNKIYFGELTYYHSSGYQNFKPKSFELLLGEKIELPNK